MKSDAKHLQSELDRITTHRPGKVNSFRIEVLRMGRVSR
jgi:hypothetical protein